MPTQELIDPNVAIDPSEVVHVHATQKALAEAAQEYAKSARAWRDSRPEFAALAAAIRKERHLDELRLLAAAAGCADGDISELMELRRSALPKRSMAAEHERRRKVAEDFDAQWRAAEERLGRAKTLDEQSACATRLGELDQPRRDARGAEIDCRLAAQTVNEAVRLGVI